MARHVEERQDLPDQVTRDQVISRLNELIFPENIKAGIVNEQAHDIVTTILAYLDDPDVTHLYYEGVTVETCKIKRGCSKNDR